MNNEKIQSSNSEKEINLFDLYVLIKNQKNKLFTAVLISFLIGAAYCFLAAENWSVKIRISKAIPYEMGEVLTLGRVYYELHNIGFNATEWSESLFTKFSTSALLKSSGNIKVRKDATGALNIESIASSAELADANLRNFVENVSFEIKQEIIENSFSLVADEKKLIDLKNEEELVMLEQALRVAKSAGIANFQAAVSTENGDFMFLLGTKYLKVKIASLKEGNGSQKTKLAKLTNKFKFLDSFKNNGLKTNVIKAQDLPRVTGSPLKPKNVMILAMSIIMGFIFGVVIIVGFYVKRRHYANA